MTKKYKRKLFLIVSLFFLISAPTLIFYSQGYRFDFENKKIVKTGGLFLKISPPGVKIYINHVLSNKTNFFFDSAFIDGLIPKNYDITIKKDQYHDWTKTLSVKEKQVTEAKNVLLLPKNPKFKIVGEDIDVFYPSLDLKNVFIKTTKDQGWSIEEINIEKRERKTIVDQQALQKLIRNEEAQVKNKNKAIINKNNYILFSSLTASLDYKKILLKTSLNGQKKYFLIDLNTVNPTPHLLAFKNMNNIRNIYFGKQDAKRIFFLANYNATTSLDSPIFNNNEIENNALGEKIKLKNSLFLGQKFNQTINFISSPLINQDIITYSLMEDNGIIWLNNSGFLYYGQIIENRITSSEVLNLKPLLIDSSANYKIIAKNNSKIFIKEDEHLYYLSPKKHIFKKIFSTVRQVAFDKSLKKIAIYNGGQIWLFYLEPENEQPQKVAEEKMLLFNSPQEIKNIFWLDNEHLLFQQDNAINVIEIDNRSKPNLVQLKSFPNPQIDWNASQKTLLVLSKNILYSCNDILR